MDAESKAAAWVVYQLHQRKCRLKEMRERLENDRIRFRHFRHLDSVLMVERQSIRQIEKLQSEIAQTEAIISSVPDDLTRKIVEMRANDKSWAAVVTTVFLTEKACMSRFQRACTALYKPMKEAGLIAGFLLWWSIGESNP